MALHYLVRKLAKADEGRDGLRQAQLFARRLSQRISPPTTGSFSYSSSAASQSRGAV